MLKIFTMRKALIPTNGNILESLSKGLSDCKVSSEVLRVVWAQLTCVIHPSFPQPQLSSAAPRSPCGGWRGCCTTTGGTREDAKHIYPRAIKQMIHFYIETLLAEIAFEDRHFFGIGGHLVYLTVMRFHWPHYWCCNQEGAGLSWPFTFLSPTFRCLSISCTV